MVSNDFPQKHFLNWLICLEYKANLEPPQPPLQPLAPRFYNTWSRTKLVLLRFLPKTLYFHLALASTLTFVWQQKELVKIIKLPQKLRWKRKKNYLREPSFLYYYSCMCNVCADLQHSCLWDWNQNNDIIVLLATPTQNLLTQQEENLVSNNPHPCIS